MTILRNGKYINSGTYLYLLTYKKSKGGTYVRKTKLSPYQWKILWVIGLVILSFICFDYQEHAQQTSKETFTITPILWINLIITILFGLYFSLLFVRKWSIQLNPSLLFCVAVPCLLLSFLYPLDATIEPINHFLAGIFSPSIYQWLLKIYAMNAAGIVGGMTLILSIFSGDREKQ